MDKRFNIRVYGILILDGKVLVNEERFASMTVIKFPGGGLQYGEGTTDGLKREWKEELGLDIEVAAHFYTTDFFQLSAIDNSQVISIYYFVTAKHPFAIVNAEPGEHTYWTDLAGISAATFTLPIDKYVGELLRQLAHP